MGVYTEGAHEGEFLMSEAPGTLSREVRTIAQNQDIAPGELMGRVTAGGQFVAWNPAAADGSEVVAGISYAAVKTGAGETRQAVTIERLAEVNGKLIVYPAGQDAAAEAGLLALDIAIR